MIIKKATGVGSMGAPGAGAPVKFLTQWNNYTRMHYLNFCCHVV